MLMADDTGESGSPVFQPPLTFAQVHAAPRLCEPAPLGPHARLRRPLPDQGPALLSAFRRPAPGPHHLPARPRPRTRTRTHPHRRHTDDETTLIVGTFTYAGTGWKTSGDALLANTAADQARKRRQAGRDELADEYAETMSSEAA